ncbi:hypothetical protein SAMN04488168_12320 [Bacillus sp. 491mf]|uniref:hypothetical protein n=1 Tax=Bacillus sp. 491mf TaxID=1761755 RepID=UPI0008E296C3|nr:hypothetical protein [Bacillus sp. 491mf]SFD18118.1 hypothetical protein SAMN04488168_12320 [Bacillus sp. 491mf]
MKKRPEQYGWKLKNIKDEDFWKWYEAQGNINDSLITLVQFFIREYGNRDVKNFDVQQEMYRSLLLKEEFFNDLTKLRNALQEGTIPVVNTTVEQVSNLENKEDLKIMQHSSENETIVVDSEEKQNQQQNVNKPKEESLPEKQTTPKEAENIFSNVDQSSIF